eukprot:gene29115-26058_t
MVFGGLVGRVLNRVWQGSQSPIHPQIAAGPHAPPESPTRTGWRVPGPWSAPWRSGQRVQGAADAEAAPKC